MRDSMIYFRNNPSILFWEAGNTVVTPDHMQQMVALRKQFDPEGGRVVGARGNDDVAANTALTPVAEYYGVMIGQDPDRPRRAQRPHRHVPRLLRRPPRPRPAHRDRRLPRRRRTPHLGRLLPALLQGQKRSQRHLADATPTTSSAPRAFALAGVSRYWDYWQNRISNPDPAHSKWSGYASIYFSDSDADGRQDSSEVARVSGKVDAVRLPKEIYFAHRVMQNPKPDLHILGHWTYPATQPDGQKTVKTIYVIANTQSVELFVNGKSAAINSKPENGWIFSFPNIEFAPGNLRAVGSNSASSKGIDKSAASDQLTTAGAPAQIKLTPTVSPRGLEADGQDAALIDVEVLDAQGNRCPTDDARIDFTCTGPAIWRGGYNSGKLDSTNNLYLNTECGINRVAIRSTRTPGTITITAARPGLKPARSKSHPVPVKAANGLATWTPPRLPALV